MSRQLEAALPEDLLDIKSTVGEWPAEDTLSLTAGFCGRTVSTGGQEGACSGD